MVRMTPLITAPEGVDPSGRTAEWMTPGPSPAAALQPDPTPFTQWVSSSSVTLKFAVRALGVMLKSTGLMAVGSEDLTMMSHVLNASNWATLTWYVTVDPGATAAWMDGEI